MPPELLEELKVQPGSFEFRFSQGERKVYRHEAYMTVSEWSEKYRTITKGPLPGSWRNALTPYLVGIMDSLDFPSVREVDAMKGPQSGVSESAFNWIGKVTDCEPGDVMAAFCDETTAKENSKDRLLPMFKSTPRLSRHLTGKQDDESAMRINLAHIAVYLSWASSSSRMANKPIRYGLADEIDKPGWDPGKNKETSP